MASKILGRAWFYDTGDPPYVECWEHELEPMQAGRRSGAEWAHAHFSECHDEKSLRELFEVPAEGNFQVLFKGEMDGAKCGSWEAPDSEWDEWFTLEESKHETIPTEYLEIRHGSQDVQQVRA